MTDPTPLINPPPPSSATTSTDINKAPSSLDDTIERCIGDYFGWRQLLRCILISLAWAFDAQQTFIAIFADADPPWHCTAIPGPNHNNDNNSCGSSNVCLLPQDAWSWDLPLYTSTISEWSLQCAGSFLTGLPASSFFAGCLAGGFLLATLADSSLGRKKLLVLSCLLMSLSGLLTALVSTNVWIYAALRFVCGFGRATVGTCALVLSTELVGKRWRGQVGMIGFLCFTLGFLSLPLIGYLNRGSSWRLLYLWTCVPAMFYSILVHFLVCESPRWLYVRGRKQEFLNTLRSIAAPITSSSSSFVINMCPGDLDSHDIDGAGASVSGTAHFSNSYSAFWETSWAFRRLLCVMGIGFGSGMVYYGIPLGLGSLAVNLYLSVTLNALLEFPASLMICFVGKLNRRDLVLGFSVVSGVCSCLICAFAILFRNSTLQIALELASFFSTCAAFNVLLIYTLELFPTCVRNSALSMVRQAVVFGGVFSPVLVAAGRNSNNGLLSYGVFGVAIAVSGLFVRCLPETKGAALCDTLDEQEQKEIVASAAPNCSSTPPPALNIKNGVVEECV